MSLLNLKESKIGSNLTYVEGSEEQLCKLFINPAFEYVKANPTKIYSAASELTIEDGLLALTAEEVKSYLVRTDTMHLEQPGLPHDLKMKVVHDTLFAQELSQFRPLESWQLDEQLRISKKVQYHILVTDNLDPVTGEVRGLTPLFVIPCATQGKGTKVATVRYLQQVNSGYGYSWYRENLEASAREKLFYPLLKKALNGELNVYAQPDAATQQMTKEEVGKNLTTIDTVYVDNPEPPYELRKEVREFMPEYTDISAIEFVEELNYAEDGSLSINVLWYAPVVTESDPITGLPKKGTEKTLFWVKCF